MEASSILGESLSSPDAKISGIILTEEFDPAIMDALTASTIPLAVIGLRHAKLECRTRSIAFVRNDNQAIGRLAAEHFLSLGKFNSYVFIPAWMSRTRFWSDERQAGFVEVLKRSASPSTYHLKERISFGGCLRFRRPSPHLPPATPWLRNSRISAVTPIWTFSRR